MLDKRMEVRPRHLEGIKLRDNLEEGGYTKQVLIPEDGDSIELYEEYSK